MIVDGEPNPLRLRPEKNSIILGAGMKIAKQLTDGEAC